MIEKEIKKAIRQAVSEAGSEIKLSQQSGVGRAHINNIKNKDNVCKTVKIETLEKLFPNMQIDFWGTGGKKGMEGKIIAMVGKLTPEERDELALTIAAKYRHAVDEH